MTGAFPPTRTGDHRHRRLVGVAGAIRDRATLAHSLAGGRPRSVRSTSPAVPRCWWSGCAPAGAGGHVADRALARREHAAPDAPAAHHRRLVAATALRRDLGCGIATHIAFLNIGLQRLWPGLESTTVPGLVRTAIAAVLANFGSTAATAAARATRSPRRREHARRAAGTAGGRRSALIARWHGTRRTIASTQEVAMSRSIVLLSILSLAAANAAFAKPGLDSAGRDAATTAVRRGWTRPRRPAAGKVYHIKTKFARWRHGGTEPFPPTGGLATGRRCAAQRLPQRPPRSRRARRRRGEHLEDASALP